MSSGRKSASRGKILVSSAARNDFAAVARPQRRVDHGVVLAGFDDGAGAGKQRHLMGRAIHHRLVGPEDLLRAVAVMHVEIDDGGASDAVIAAAHNARRWRRCRRSRIPSAAPSRRDGRAAGWRRRRCSPFLPEPRRQRISRRRLRAAPPRNCRATSKYRHRDARCLHSASRREFPRCSPWDGTARCFRAMPSAPSRGPATEIFPPRAPVRRRATDRAARDGRAA